MDINKMYVRQGETFQLPIENDDLSATTVQFVAWNDDGRIIDEIENFIITGDKTVATISKVVNDPLGTYNYLIIVTYSDGNIDKLPDPDECDGDCELPELIICEAEPILVS